MNKNIVYVAATLIALAISACGERNENGENNAQPVAEGLDVVPSAPIQFKDAASFPPHFVPDFSYKIRSKATDVQGVNTYRKLNIEFQGLDPAAADKSIEKSMARAGYKRYKTMVQDNGTIVGDYGRYNPEHRVTVYVNPAVAGASYMNLDTKGTAYFVWKQ